MWKKINNYKYHLKDLKFMIWLFPIIGVIYACEFFYRLMFHQEFHWTKLIFIAIMLIGFLDIKKKIRNNDYRTD
ncbi:TPA: hypothetical protein QCR58_003028 [Bacillus cereus]|uniref:Uncharacterized protein n=1 Tax=Bacillus thuringiensis serovar kumamotoensis TaxID=132267 RepID=A0A9X6JJI4_BACUK|nr:MULTISPECIES: hypothetical protein [Bacillus cereus group]EKS7844765.1 hypothetical protein [Bacillus cereus]MEC2873180.1 hypothetical protein [Bacillus cereus]OTZ68137.1 hypothetical protein BK769_24495 [Bacillus thuringiensis serovar kumamtoensis]PEE95544.1 hypothetical protein COM92_06540 [Bacillus cereus]PGN78719.1 hypothetical protein CN967_12600 [Bacillus cereus]